MSKKFAEINNTIFYLQRFTKRKIMTMTSAYRSISIFVSIMIVLMTPRLVLADAKIRSNVIYGMYSGLALLMDVHQPANPNGYGIIFIRGSSWRAPLDLDARPLKNKPNGQVATLLGQETGGNNEGSSRWNMWFWCHAAGLSGRDPARLPECDQ